MEDKKTDEAAGQGFNDSELADIMSEIESLEKDFEGDSSSQSDGTTDFNGEVHGEGDSDPKAQQQLQEQAEEQSQGQQQEQQQSAELSETLEATGPVNAEDDSNLETAELENTGDQDSGESDQPKAAQDAAEAESESQEEDLDQDEAVQSQRTGDPQGVEDSEFSESKSPPRGSSHLASVDSMPEGASMSQISSKTNAQTKMDFCVEGDMSLWLNFQIAGKAVKVLVNADDGLVLEMDGGMRFTVPVDKDDRKKSAA